MTSSRRPGRPPSDDPHTRQVHALLTPAQYDALLARVGKRGNLSGYLRALIVEQLGAENKSRIETPADSPL